MKKLLLVLVLFASTTIYAQSYNQGFKDGWSISKENLGDLNGAYKDWRKAASLGHSNSAKWVRDQCN